MPTVVTAVSRQILETVPPSGPAAALAPRWQRGAEHLHRLGPRALYEFLRELAVEHDIEAQILAKLDLWRVRLTPELLRAVGGDGFPPHLSMLPGGR